MRKTIFSVNEPDVTKFEIQKVSSQVASGFSFPIFKMKIINYTKNEKILSVKKGHGGRVKTLKY